MLENARTLAAGRFEIEGMTTDQLIEQYARLTAANATMTEAQKQSIYEILGVTAEWVAALQEVENEITGESLVSAFKELGLVGKETSEDVKGGLDGLMRKLKETEGITGDVTSGMRRKWDRLTEDEKQKAQETWSRDGVVPIALRDAALMMIEEMEDMGVSWDDLTKETKRLAKETWGRSGKVATALSEAIEAMKGKIGELPRSFTFDVYGRYHAPEIPSYQMGISYVPRTTLAVLHKGEAVIPTHRTRSERGTGITTGNIIINLPNVKDVAGFKRLRPTEWKRHIDGGPLEGLKMAAREGKISRESVMMDR